MKWDEQLRALLFSLVNDLLVQRSNQNQKCIIGGFSSLDDEVSWELGFPHQDQLSYPVVDQDDLIFRRSDLSDLKEQVLFGRTFKVPSSDKEIVTPDILIIPGVAFSARGERLGRGKGFYDRYLKNFSGTRIGICYELQLLDKLPSNNQDENVQYVITNQRIIDCSKNRTGD